MQSLRVKLIAPFMLGMFALTLLLAWYTYDSAKKAVESAMLLISEAKTARTAGAMDLLFKSMTANVRNMAEDPHVAAVFSGGGTAGTNTAEWLGIITSGNEYYRDILLVDDRGICVASSTPGQVGHSFFSKPHVRKALQGHFAVGAPVVGRNSKRLSAVVAGPVLVGDRLAGALLLFNDLPDVVDYTVTEHDARTIFRALLTPDGLFAAHKDADLMGNPRKRYPELYDSLAFVGERGGAVSYELDGRRYVGFARVDPTSQWMVLASGVEAEVFAPATRVGLTVFGISFAMLCLVSMVVVRVANGILQSLFSLINYAKEVSEGGLDRQLEDSTRKDELGVLHASLQRLVASLRDMLIQTREASRMKGQFLANMSHEIRTPLNAIIGVAHLCLRDAALPPRQRAYLEKIQVAARSLLGLVNDILDLSKVEAGMLELEDRPFSLKEALGNVLAIHQDLAESKGLGLCLRYAENAPEYFIGDPLRLSQVLNNLVGNAVKFTREGGVTIDCGLADQEREEAGAERGKRALLRIGVSDTGIGIAKDRVDALFQPFTQADASTSRQYGGTGLGLAISKRIVHLLGGDITVTSTPGRGTTFSFTVRLLPDPSGAARREECCLDKAFEQLDLMDTRILVAEDNAVNQMIMRELLAPTGATVIMADNGVQAVEAANSQVFDLIFMDLQMPVMDGLEATRHIRAFAPPDDLPIIAVTANAMKEDKARGFACGMNDYLTKPIEPGHLLDMLRIWLKRDTSAGAACRGRGSAPDPAGGNDFPRTPS